MTDTETTDAVRTLAKRLYDSIERIETTDGGSRYVVRGDAPDALRALYLQMHDIDDWNADKSHSMLERIAYGDVDVWSGDAEINLAEGLEDVYNTDLCAWLVGNMHWTDEAIETFGPPETTGALIQYGQGIALESLAARVVRALIDAAEDEEDDDESEDAE